MSDRSSMVLWDVVERVGGRVMGFDVTPVELRVCGSMLATISEDLHTEIGVLRRAMDSLLATGWQGAAAKGFAQGWDQWSHGARDVLDALHAMGRLLDDTGQDYQGSDISSADNVTQSGAGL